MEPAGLHPPQAGHVRGHTDARPEIPAQGTDVRPFGTFYDKLRLSLFSGRETNNVEPVHEHFPLRKFGPLANPCPFVRPPALNMHRGVHGRPLPDPTHHGRRGRLDVRLSQPRRALARELPPGCVVSVGRDPEGHDTFVHLRLGHHVLQQPRGLPDA